MTKEKPTTDDDSLARSIPDWSESDFWTGEDRGQVVAIDFLFSMIIRVTAIGIVLAASATLMYSAVGTSYTEEFAAQNGANQLADDVLLTSPGHGVLNASCTEAFFAKDTSVCGHNDEWTSGENPYLNEVFGLNETTDLNVTIRTTSGDLASLSGTDLALGNAVPTNGDVHSWRRTVALDTNGDGNPEWHILRVRAW